MAIANDLAVLVFCDALFHTFAASMVKLFFANVDHTVPVRSPLVLLLVSTPSTLVSLVSVLQVLGQSEFLSTKVNQKELKAFILTKLLKSLTKILAKLKQQKS